MINIGLIGLGNVGQGVVQIIEQNKAIIEERISNKLNIKSIAVRNLDKYKHLQLKDVRLTSNIDDLLNDPEIDIIVELIGGENPAYDYICSALKNSGITDILKTINKFNNQMEKSGWKTLNRKNQILYWLHIKIKDELGRKKYNTLLKKGKFNEFEREVLEGKTIYKILDEIE